MNVIEFMQGIGKYFFFSGFLFYLTILFANTLSAYTSIYYLHISLRPPLYILIFLSFIAIVYSIFIHVRKPLNEVLGSIHFAGTVIPLAIIFIMNAILNNRVPRRYYSFDSSIGDQCQVFDSNVVLTSLFIVIAAAQLLFFANISLTLFRRKTK